MAGLLSNVMKEIVPAPVPKNGTLMGGEVVPKQMYPDLDDTIEGQFSVVPPMGIDAPTPPAGGAIPPNGGFPTGKVVAGGAAAAGGLSLMGGDDDPNAALARVKNPEEETTVDDLVTVTNEQKKAAIEQGVDVSDPEKPEDVDQGYWDTLLGEFDLMTVGLSLLATNDGSAPLTANLGKALQAGRKAAKKKILDKAGAEAASREESREERRVALKELEARSGARQVDINGLSEARKATEAAAKANGISLGVPSTEQQQEVADFATLLTGSDKALNIKGKKPNPTDKAFVREVARAIELEEKIITGQGGVMTAQQRQDVVAQALKGYLKDSTIFGISTGNQKLDRDKVQQKAQSEQAVLERIRELKAKQ